MQAWLRRSRDVRLTLSAHTATHALKHHLEPPHALTRDPRRRAFVFAGRNAELPVMYGLEAPVFASAHVDAPQTAAARAAEAVREIGKIFLEAF
jgi:hypothetical protein